MADIKGELCGGRLASHSDRTRCLEQCHAPSHAFACTEAGSCWVGAVGSAEPPQYTSLDASFTPPFSHRPCAYALPEQRHAALAAASSPPSVAE